MTTSMDENNNNRNGSREQLLLHNNNYMMQTNQPTQQPQSSLRHAVRHPSGPTPINTDVVVIGNGPSAICLSYLLSGHWPYYASCPEDESSPHPYLGETLQSRMRNVSPEYSFVEQDLRYLSEGLEGRSSNPVALLFDSLSNPGADLGLRLPSLLHWEWEGHREVDHVVLGRKDVGGVWQRANNQTHISRTKTVSIGSWMELPEVSLEDWLNETSPERNKGIAGRANMDDISGYYREYIRRHRLSKNFRNHSVVTSLNRITSGSDCGSVDCESGESEQELEPEAELQAPDQQAPLLWEVCGYRTTHDERGRERGRREEFRYIAPNVVLATGIFDIPNRLGVPGEHLPYVLHSYQDLERRLERHSTLQCSSDPVVVIGGGLSAADAIITLRHLGVQVVHVHRGGSSNTTDGGVYRQLVPTVYPEYHEVNNLMHLEYTPEWYTGYSGYEVCGFTAERHVLIRCMTSEREATVKASLVVVLIGSCPDLTFICPSVLKNLGVVPNAPINGRRNLVDVNPFTYESVRHQGLYAMGPLVGDHMVRFLRGGALAVTSHVWQKRQKASDNIPLDATTTTTSSSSSTTTTTTSSSLSSSTTTTLPGDQEERIENQWTTSLER